MRRRGRGARHAGPRTLGDVVAAIAIGLGGGVAAMAAATAPSAAQTLSAEVRPRFEGRRIDGESDTYTTMRTRLGMFFTFEMPGAIFVQIQDVRRWGTRPGDASAEALDLHQGWWELGERGRSRLWLRAGRQEMNFGTRRLVASPPWSQASRSYDALRSTVRIGERSSLDLFTAKVAGPSGAAGGDASLSGVWLEASAGAMRRGSVYLLAETDGRSGARNRTTVGGELSASVGRIGVQLEGALQNTEDIDEAASLVAVRVTAPLGGGATVGAGVDRLSGAATAARRPFSRLYGLAHGFYGYADLFTDFDTDTGGRGLIDWTARGVLPLDGGWSLQVDLHRFSVAEDVGFENAHLADEVDLSTRWQSSEGVSLLGGVSFVGEGDALAAVGRPDLGQLFAYLQVGVSLDGVRGSGGGGR